MFERHYYQPPAEALPKVDWIPPIATDLPSTWAGISRIGFDLETRDENLKDLGPGCRRDPAKNYVIGYSIAFEDGKDFYLPVRHEGGDNCQWDVRSYLRDNLRGYRGSITGANNTYDMDWSCTDLGDTGILGTDQVDVQCMDVLCDENQLTYSLEMLCRRHELPGKEEEVLRHAAAAYRLDPKLGMWRMSARYAAQYAMADARRVLQLRRRLERRLESEGCDQIWALERQVTPILVKMRRRGVRVDLDKVSHIEALSLEEEAKYLDRVRQLTGVSINVGDVWRAEVYAHALRAAGHDVPRGKKGPSVDKILLAKCGEVGEFLLYAREWNKLRTTFCKSIREYAICHGPNNWRIHCSLHQLRANDDDGDGAGVRYGRFSSTDPNLQQQPIRNDHFGELWRSVFVADEGCEWVCSDWSQQEPRIGVHYAELLGLPGAREFADAYRANPNLDVHQRLADLSGIVRKIVKNYVNGLLYGMGDAKLCRAIGQPTEMRMIRGEPREVAGPEGQAIIDQFESFAPWLRGLTKEASKQAKRVGHVWTAMRRKCRFVRGPNGEYMYTHKAFNRVGQGSAADSMKATLIEADKEGIPVQLAVHDEFDFSRPKGDRAMSERLRELQMNTVRFSVPMKVDVEVGPSWGELTKEAA